MFIKIKKYADKKKIMVSASVFDLDLAKFLNDLEVPLNKIASSELTNLELIDYLSKSKNTRCGLIDYQDAVIGPCAYDLASLTQDARIDVPKKLELELINYFTVKKT